MTEETIKAIKGFNRDMTCRGYKFEEGKTYRHEGPVEACKSGFHAIEGHPLEVFGYYPPGTSVFYDVECAGEISRHGDDSKIASAEITIKGSIIVPELVSRAIRFVMDRANPEVEEATGWKGAASATGTQGAASATGDHGAASATGTRGAASATGTRGAASATGEQGAASATGYHGAASATGTRGAAFATGYQGAASATGYQGAASATGTRGAAFAMGEQGAASATGTRGAAFAMGEQGAASATGYQGAASATSTRGAASAMGEQGAASATGWKGRVMGAEGNALFLVERYDDGDIIAVWAGIAGKDGIEPGVFYTLSNGVPTKVES